jgi:choline dehydrogenase-like flavoprotein
MRSFFSVCASLALVHHAATLDLTNSVLSPFYNSINSLLKGDGLSEAALGAIGGVLGQDQKFDYLVAGGGTAGNTMGTRLAQAGYKVAIIEAGAFQSPQLLMVSGIGPKETLNKFDIKPVSTLEGVGQNMWDHIFFGPSYQVGFETLNAVLRCPISLAKAVTQYALSKSGPLTSNIIKFIGWEKLPNKYRTKFSPETEKALAQFPDDLPEVEYLGANGFLGNFEWPILQQPIDGKQYATMLGAMVAPISRGNVTISSN